MRYRSLPRLTALLGTIVFWGGCLAMFWDWPVRHPINDCDFVTEIIEEISPDFPTPVPPPRTKGMPK